MGTSDSVVLPHRLKSTFLKLFRNFPELHIFQILEHYELSLKAIEFSRIQSQMLGPHPPK